MKFKLDENLPVDLAARLLAAGHDAISVLEEGLGGKGDPTLLEAATNEGRILMTYDLDFASVRQYPPGTHTGIVVFRLRDQRWQSLEKPLDRLLADESLQKVKNGLAIVDELRIRFKHTGQTKRKP